MKSFRGYVLSNIPMVLVMLALLVACSQMEPEPLTVEMLNNAEYYSELFSDGIAKLTDGEYQEEIVADAASTLSVVVYPDMHAFGDLNRDEIDDAAIVLATSGGGSGTYISLEAVINDNGSPNHIATANLGDRVKVNSVVIDGGEIIVDLITHGPDDALCCPTVEATQKLKLVGDTLVQIVDE